MLIKLKNKKLRFERRNFCKTEIVALHKGQNN